MALNIFGLYVLSKEEYDLVHKEKIDLINENIVLETKNLNYLNSIKLLNDDVVKYNDSINSLNAEIKLLTAVDPLEDLWNNKRQKADITYNGREIPGKSLTYRIDVRNFFNPYDSTIPTLPSGLTNDEVAVSALRWVHDNITYFSDNSSTGYNEYWQFPFETLCLKTGDCEDGAILIANIMLKAGVPYWRIRLNAGDVKGGGHAYVTYLRQEDDKWYVLDWCYWYDESLVNFGTKEFKDLEKYYGIWFSWNQKFAFYTPTYDVTCVQNNIFTIVL